MSLPTSQRGLSAHLFHLMEHCVATGLMYEPAVLAARRRWMAAKRYDEAVKEKGDHNE